MRSDFQPPKDARSPQVRTTAAWERDEVGENLDDKVAQFMPGASKSTEKSTVLLVGLKFLACHPRGHTAPRRIAAISRPYGSTLNTAASAA